MTTPVDPTRNIGGYSDAELAKFLSRPIRVTIPGATNGLWQQATNINWLLDPWSLFFADPRVINRLTHYHLFRCTLCVKFVLNGNPFLYGQLMASYMPYHSDLANSTTTMDGRSPCGTGISSELVLASQRPKVFLTPMMSSGACMKLPFFQGTNWFSVETGGWTQMGKISIVSMNQLKHANAGTESVTVSAFVWAEDVEMSVPTSYPAYGLVAQAGKEMLKDEYSGPVSHPASVLSRAAAAARNAPMVGPYAMATSIAAGSVAAISDLLGYSRPVDLAAPVRMANNPTPNMAATTAEDSSDKLTVDPKQGVTIDTRVMGLDGTDELSILHLAKVESYVTTFTWPVGSVADTVLFSIPVTPMVYGHWNGTASIITPTSIAAVAAPFKYWRGTIIYRFQAVCTQYHKGRLRILYDPFSQQGISKFNVNYTKIVDLGEDTDFEMSVSWAQSDLVLNVATPNFATSTEIWSSTIVTPSSTTDNGVLTVAIFNSLTAPNDVINNDIGINVFVKAGDDFELCVPTSDTLDALCLVPQAQWESFDNPDDYLSVGEPSSSDDLFKVIVGERVTNFRALLKRYNKYITSYITAGASSSQLVTQVFRNFPLTPGSDITNGLHTSAGLSKKVNFVSMTLLSYLASMFAAYRGAIRYKHFVTFSSTTGRNLMVTRDHTNAISSVPVATTITSTNDGMAFGALSIHKALGGTSVVVSNAKPVIEVELPYYFPGRFNLVRQYRTNSTSGACHQLKVMYPTSEKMSVESWVSIGEDFSFGFFTGSNLWYANYLVA